MVFPLPCNRWKEPTMALDARTRSSIYQKLVPLLGSTDSNALMSEFPSIEADELVTKQFLRAELALLRGELRGEMAELRGDMASMETRLTVRIGAAMAANTTIIIGALALFR
jgi:hypothetical protein